MALIIPSYTATANEEIAANFGLAQWNAAQKLIDPNHVDRNMNWWILNILVRPILRNYFLEKFESDAAAARKTLMDANPPDVLTTS